MCGLGGRMTGKGRRSEVLFFCAKLYSMCVYKHLGWAFGITLLALWSVG